MNKSKHMLSWKKKRHSQIQDLGLMSWVQNWFCSISICWKSWKSMAQNQDLIQPKYLYWLYYFHTVQNRSCATCIFQRINSNASMMPFLSLCLTFHIMNRKLESFEGLNFRLGIQFWPLKFILFSFLLSPNKIPDDF